MLSTSVALRNKTPHSKLELCHHPHSPPTKDLSTRSSHSIPHAASTPPTSATMPRAEAGSLKALSNKMKSKGLQRLRWYCQVCEKQCRDENGFKCHTQSESHVRQMMVVGENAPKHIKDYSMQFRRDFLTLLRTAHGEKSVNANRFYQEYIQDKEHVHMNATRWKTLSEFVKSLGREGVCRVEDGEKGLWLAWIDNSPEAMRRADAIRKKERQDRGDEEREQRAIEEAMERARAEGKLAEGPREEDMVLKREEGEKISLKIGFGKKASGEEIKKSTPPADAPMTDAAPTTTTPAPAPAKLTLSSTAKPTGISKPSKPKNVFAMANKKAKESGAIKKVAEPPKKISEAERIMREEMEAKKNGTMSRGFSMNMGNANKVPVGQRRV